MSWNEPGAVTKALVTLGVAAIKARPTSMRHLRSYSNALQGCLAEVAAQAVLPRVGCPAHFLA